MIDNTTINNVKGKASISKGDKIVVLEEGRQLSQSLLWEIQRNYFEREGVEAWQKGTVPHYITSNTFIANAYAKILLGFMRDCWTENGNGSSAFNPNNPIYIIELGCGHGRFSYHLLKKFRDMHHKSSLSEIPFKYIMSDLSEKNIQFWRSHELLGPFVEEGILDFARFDPQCESQLKLIQSGQTLSSESKNNPIVFIANYFFDSIPMDAFYINDNRLYEKLTKITSSQEEPDATDPGIFKRMKVSYNKVETQTDYYENDKWNQILKQYTQNLTDSALLFPTGALECIENLEQLSDGRMILLSADRGDCNEIDLQGRKKTRFAEHGSISMRVNYHAIGQYFVNKGGVEFQPHHHPASLVVAGFVLGNSGHKLVETKLAYEEAINEFGPDDFFTLKKNLQDNCDELDIEQLLAFIRLSNWDSKIFMSCFPVLMSDVIDAGDEQKREILKTVEQVWEMFYPLGEKKDVAFHIGTLLCQMDYFREALRYFEESIKGYGEAPGVLYNMALCYDGIDNLEKTLECVDKALKLNPEFEPALEFRVAIEASLNNNLE